jgi:hypothetical protein
MQPRIRDVFANFPKVGDRKKAVLKLFSLVNKGPDRWVVCG